MHNKIPSLISLAICVALSGCSTFADTDYHQTAIKALADRANSQFTQSTEGQPALTELIADPLVQDLVAKALAHNPNLKQTLITLKISQQRLTQTQANERPTLDARVSGNRQQDSENSYTGSLNLSWTLDLWQKLDDSTQAQLASVKASQFNYQAAQDLLAANVIQGYLQLIQQAQLVSIEQQRVKTLTTNEAIIVSRYKKGLIDLKDLDTAKSNTQSAQASLVSYRFDYQQSLANLALLTGETELTLSYLTHYPLVTKPTQAIDTQYLGQRPDLQQAYQTILLNQYQHKVAYKSLLPEFTLTGSFSNTDSNLHQALFGSSAWQLLGQLSAPLFNSGKLKSEAEVAKLGAEQSYWQFQEKLLNAVNEVNMAMLSEHTLKQRLQLLEQAYESAQRSEATYTERYRQGTVSLIDLLQVQQSTFALQSQLSQLNYQHLNNRIQLGLALGYGV